MCVQIYKFIYIYIYIYIYICEYIYIYIYISMSVCACVNIYIYIYIFTTLISTSIHGTRKKQKKPWPGTRDKSISNHRPGEKEKSFG